MCTNNSFRYLPRQKTTKKNKKNKKKKGGGKKKKKRKKNKKTETISLKICAHQNIYIGQRCFWSCHTQGRVFQCSSSLSVQCLCCCRCRCDGLRFLILIPFTTRNLRWASAPQILLSRTGHLAHSRKQSAPEHQSVAPRKLKCWLKLKWSVRVFWLKCFELCFVFFCLFVCFFCGAL